MKIWKFYSIPIMLFILFFSFNCAARLIPIKKHPIYSRLVKLQPSLDKTLAMMISNEILKCHKRIGVDKYLLAAIYNQESQINYKAQNCLKSILKPEAIDKLIHIFKKDVGFIVNEDKLRNSLSYLPLKTCFDLGIGQINVATALKLDVCSDLKRLHTDYEYNIRCSCRVLESFKKGYKHKENFWWTRYNASNSIKRERYRLMVMRYYPKGKSSQDVP